MSDSEKNKGERIAKYLARAGVASRRDAEKMVLEGRITVDGKALDHPAFLVTDKSKITVDGKPIKKNETVRLWRYNKPEGLIVSARDPQGRQTIFEDLPKHMPRVVSVGRLDLNSEGLLLLTNDGELARHLEMSDHPRQYRVRIQLGNKSLPEDRLEEVAKGATIEGVRYKPVKIEIGHAKGSNTWVDVTLHEGKNREIRNIMRYLDTRVNRLQRVAFGPFQLGRLEPGMVEEIPASLLKKYLPKFFKG
jgi:23S rRNA pseudouridine2605 synthase